MPLSRRTFIARTTALAVINGFDLAQEDAVSGAAFDSAAEGVALNLPAVTLHGYGTISAVFRVFDRGRASLTTIACETAQKALLTQAKYLSDLERLRPLATARLAHNGHKIPFRRTASGGAVACYTHGRDVLILAAMDEPALTRLCARIVPPSATVADFEGRVPVPMYLDRWDRYGLLCYFAPEATPPGVSDRSFDYNDGLKFAQDHDLGLVVWTNPLVDDYAEGLTNEQAWDWMQAEARKRGIPVHINTQISPPQLWLANRYREQTMLKAPQFLGGYYGVAHDSAGVGAISWLSQEAEDALLGVFQSTVRRFAQDPNIVGWLEPHGETYETPQKYFLDSGAYADERLRGFLRQRYRTLRALSETWHGDANHYPRWDDVHLPEVADFAGFGPDAIDLRGAWRVKYVPAPDGHRYSHDEARGLPSPPPTAPVPTEWYQLDYDDSEWDELIAPGNDWMLYLQRSPLVYRRTLDIPAAWLASAPQVTLYVWDLANRDADATIVTVNGHPLHEQSQNANDEHWSRFEVTGLLRPGRNTFVLQMPRALICYRAYLTGEPPRQYPHLGPHKNAQWVDLVEWNIDTRGAQIRRGAEMIRQADAHRSINFMAAGDYADPVKRACRDYGGRFHDTGAMAGFWTEEYTLLMNGAGLPVTAEAGNGAPNAREFQLFWGRWLTEGVTGVHYFQNWGEIAWNPEVLKIFEANRAMYEIIGKYHAPFARVAVLFSLPSAWLTGFPWLPEPGSRGGYYSGYNAAGQLLAYCPRDGIGVKDFGAPAVNRYRVIIDSNSVFMAAELIDGIETYVRQGGVFITYGQTGRHTPVQPDAWPISRLTGYEVAHPVGGNDAQAVSLAAGQTVFAPSDLPPHTRAEGLALKPVAPECRSLAVWNDGATAIGIRPLGVGWIVHMGPVFRDERFVALTGALLRHFGVTDRVPATVAPQRGLHLRHFISNTGLHDVWVLFNESDSPVTTDLTFLPNVHPISLTEVVSGEKAEVVRGPGGDAVRGIVLERWQTRMYLSPRAEVADSPLEWLRLQRGWWQGTVKPPIKLLPSPAELQRFSVDLTQGWAYKSVTGLTDDQIAALAQPAVDDAMWERRQLDLWLTPKAKSARRHLLRRRFVVPAHWTAGRIVLCADVPIAQFFHETRLFLDGHPWAAGRKMVDGPYFDAMDGALRPGTTHLLTLDIQSTSSLSGSRGPIWLYYLPDPQAVQDLAGVWTAYSDPLHKTGEVQLPGSVKGMFLSRTVPINAAHRGRNVVIIYEATGDRFSLLINGRLLNRSEQIRESVTCFNVTPLIRFGDQNLVELVGGSGSNEKSIHHIEIRYYDKGVYP
jgi:hypothetical protein